MAQRNRSIPLEPGKLRLDCQWLQQLMTGFQFRADAERFWREVAQRLEELGLKLHPEKTRLIEFGRFARENRSRKRQGKPQTFDSPGFTHCCGTVVTVGG